MFFSCLDFWGGVRRVHGKNNFWGCLNHHNIQRTRYVYLQCVWFGGAFGKSTSDMDSLVLGSDDDLEPFG